MLLWCWLLFVFARHLGEAASSNFVHINQCESFSSQELSNSTRPQPSSSSSSPAGSNPTAGDVDVKGNAPRPHIVLVLFDDLGYHDLGSFTTEKRHQCNCPVMSHLMESGVRLSNFYALPTCSPTRAALMTGRYPFRYGAHFLVAAGLAGHQGFVPVGEPFLPERLRDAGYATYMVGKWHLGFSRLDVAPTGRGFQEFYGKYHGMGDHWTHSVNGSVDSDMGSVWPGHPDYLPHDGVLDLHHERWEVKDGKPRHMLKHIIDQNGTHSSDVFGSQAVRMIQSHDPRQPMFLYLAFQAPHYPVQNPAGTEERHLHIPGMQRRKWCGSISHIDDNVGRVVAALKANHDMWKNTLFIALSDNGGDIRPGASNHPYRGQKGSVWEGGTKTPAFVFSADEELLPAAVRGTTNPGLGHVTDLLPTLVRLAGGDIRPTSTGPLDGVDQWDSWRSRSVVSKRKDMVYNFDNIGLANYIILTSNDMLDATSILTPQKAKESREGLPRLRVDSLGNAPEQHEAIRVGRWKLIKGLPGRGDWYGTNPLASELGKEPLDAALYDLLESGGPFRDMSIGDGGQARVARERLASSEAVHSTLKKLWLFDLEADPTERNDLSAKEPEIVATLERRLDSYRPHIADSIFAMPFERWTAETVLRAEAMSRGSVKRIPGSHIRVQDWWDYEGTDIQSKL
eukprot:TRINITY_DN61057_c0_g1_i1.p1 TRINITY_DN61057_c0_g1~~TRINITY_DN61057_c0_g1_i1.p1  ORF type:complete len:688 (+),score=70.67 TRINITY_DN61057_c0_g1_i1:25-2064(+)